MITFLLFVGFIFLLFWISSISNRVAAMEKRLQSGAVTTPDKVPVVVKLPEAQSVASWKPGSLENWQAVANQSVENAQVKPEVHAPTQASAKNKDADDTEKAVNWLNRIGVVALVLGLGFFLKIAIDLGWIGPWAQVIIGLAIGGLLIYLGQLWKEKFGTRAQALIGGGVAILYFSIYAAFNFYSLVPQFVAFMVMLAVAGFAVWLSYKNSSLVLGVLAFFGAYGSPLMFSSGQDQQIMLFGFLTVLNVAAFVLMFRKYWMELLLLALFGTIIDFLVWGVSHSNYENTLTSLTFVIVTMLLFVIGSAGLFRLHSEKKTLAPDFGNGVTALQIISGTFFFGSIVALLFDRFHNILPAVALLGAVTYFFSYALVDRLNYRNLNYCMSFCGSLLLTSAAVWQFDGKALSAVLLLIALLGSTIGTMVKREELRVWGTTILFISLIKSLYDPYTAADAAFLFNAKFGLMFANTLGLLFVGWLYQKVQASEFEKNAEKVLQIAAALVLWASVSWDISSSISGNSQNYMTLWWVIYPVALSATGFMSRRSDISKTALFLLAAGFFKVLFLPYAGEYTFLYNVKFGLMAMETAGLLVVARFYRHDVENKSFADALKVAACMLLWFAVSWDITKYFENEESKNARNLFLSLWWITYSAILIGAGIAWRSPLLRKIAIGLFFVTIVKVFLFDLLSLDLGYLIISFISLGVILISVSFYYNKHKEQITKFLEGEEKSNNIIKN